MKRIGLGILGSFLALPAFAGLTDSTYAFAEIKGWLVTFFGIAILLYLLYNVLMAIMERKCWSDVGKALGYSALAIIAVFLGNWLIGAFR